MPKFVGAVLPMISGALFLVGRRALVRSGVTEDSFHYEVFLYSSVRVTCTEGRMRADLSSLKGGFIGRKGGENSDPRIAVAE